MLLRQLCGCQGVALQLLVISSVFFVTLAMLLSLEWLLMHFYVVAKWLPGRCYAVAKVFCMMSSLC